MACRGSMILKQKTTALKNRDFPKGNNCSNDKFEHYQFGNNVLLDIPSYQNQKNNVPPHTKVCGLNGTCFLDDPKLKPVSYDPILKNGVLIYGHNTNNILQGRFTFRASDYFLFNLKNRNYSFLYFFNSAYPHFSSTIQSIPSYDLEILGRNMHN